MSCSECQLGRTVSYCLLGRTRRCWSPPSLPRTRTRPATERSRSNQVCQRPPPYGSTPTIRYPAFVLFETGLSLRHGLRASRRRPHAMGAVLLLTFATVSSRGSHAWQTLQRVCCMHLQRSRPSGRTGNRWPGHAVLCAPGSGVMRTTCQCVRRPYGCHFQAGSLCRPQTRRSCCGCA
jgi:hypothetical protein